MRNTPKENAEQEAERRAEEVAEEASPWVDRLARLGYVTKGAVYVLVGALAVGVATGVGGRTTDLRGALETIRAQPFGLVLLGLIAVGFAGYALWRLIQAVADPDGEGRDIRAIAIRLGDGGAAGVYSVLAFTAGELVVTPSVGGSPKAWTAWLLSWPFGWALAAGVGVGVAGYGLHEIYKAYKVRFEAYLKRGEINDTLERWITRVGRFGLAARGAVIGVAGVLVVLAALQLDASEAASLGEALQTLLRQPFGSWLLGAAALGLIAYGLLMLAMARYARIAAGRAF